MKKTISIIVLLMFSSLAYATNLSVVSSSLTSSTANYATTAGVVSTAAQPAITSLGTLTGLSVAPDTDVTVNIGRLAISGIQTDQAQLSHIDQNSSTGYALRADSSGNLNLNSPTAIYFKGSGSGKAAMDLNGDWSMGSTTPVTGTKLTVTGGVSVNGNVSGNFFIGDGSLLSNVVGGAGLSTTNADLRYLGITATAGTASTANYAATANFAAYSNSFLTLEKLGWDNASTTASKTAMYKSLVNTAGLTGTPIWHYPSTNYIIGNVSTDRIDIPNGVTVYGNGAMLTSGYYYWNSSFKLDNLTISTNAPAGVIVNTHNDRTTSGWYVNKLKIVNNHVGLLTGASDGKVFGGNIYLSDGGSFENLNFTNCELMSSENNAGFVKTYISEDQHLQGFHVKGFKATGGGRNGQFNFPFEMTGRSLPLAIATQVSYMRDLTFEDLEFNETPYGISFAFLKYPTNNYSGGMAGVRVKNAYWKRSYDTEGSEQLFEVSGDDIQIEGIRADLYGGTNARVIGCYNTLSDVHGAYSDSLKVSGMDIRTTSNSVIGLDLQGMTNAQIFANNISANSGIKLNHNMLRTKIYKNNILVAGTSAICIQFVTAKTTINYTEIDGNLLSSKTNPPIYAPSWNHSSNFGNSVKNNTFLKTGTQVFIGNTSSTHILSTTVNPIYNNYFGTEVQANLNNPYVVVENGTAVISGNLTVTNEAGTGTITANSFSETQFAVGGVGISVNTTAMTFPATGTWVTVNSTATYALGNVVNLTVSTTNFTITAISPGLYRVYYGVSMTGTNSKDYHIAPGVNGTANIDAAGYYQFGLATSGATNEETGFRTNVFRLVAGDKVSLYIAAQTDTTAATVSHGSLAIERIAP